MKTKMTMKRILLAIALLAGAFHLNAVDPVKIVVSANITGPVAGTDRRVAGFIVDSENARRANNPQLALPQLATDNQSLKSSLEAALSQHLVEYLIDKAVLAEQAGLEKLAPETRRDVNAAVTDALSSGKTPAQITAAIKGIQ